MTFVTWQPYVVVVSENPVNGKVLIWLDVVVFLCYLPESFIHQSVSYYFLAENCGCGWR
jgi:hypothetical protein